MMQETEREFSEGLKNIDGINFKISAMQTTFLFLIKVIDGKILNMMLTDSADKFWIGDFDIQKINAIRSAMKLQGSYKEFFSTMATMLKTNHYEIELGRNSDLDLIVEFHLQGIIISSKFNIGKPFKREESQSIYYQLQKAFVLDLYNAQLAEKSAIEEENSQLKLELKQFKDQIEDGRLIKVQASGSQSQSMELNSNASKKIKPKTSIFNPQMRKRRALGAKIIEDN